MPRTTSTRHDEAFSSILGFIVGFALLAGAMATVAYFMISVPETGTTEESKDLESFVQNAADALAKSPGHPHEWHDSCEADSLGLLRAGTSIARLEKIQCFQTGQVDATNLLEANDLRGEGIRLYAEGTVVPLSSMKAPSTTQYALLAGDLDGNDLDEVTWDETSNYVLQNYSTVDPSFSEELHEWAWRLDTDPEEGLGNTFVDHPWHVHTQLIPVMAGLEATYTLADVHDEEDEDWGDAAMTALQRYMDDDPLTRWNIAVNGEPHDIRFTEDDFVLTVTECTKPQPCENTGNNPHWTTTDGMRSFALLDSLDVTGAEELTITFNQRIDFSDDDAAPLCSQAGAGEACVNVSPILRFWNTTEDGRWSSLQSDPEDCPSTSGWNQSTGEKFEEKSVNLCEVLENTAGEAWLGLEWFTECESEPGGTKTSCADVYDSASYERGIDEVQRAWFIEDLEIAADGETLFSTDFAPGGAMETLVLSQGVDHALHSVFDGGGSSTNLDRLLAPLSSFTGNNANLIAFAPGEQGNLLEHVGLQAIEYTDGEAVETKDADRLIMRMPHELPLQHSQYQATSVAWDPSQDINVVQWTSDEKAATLVTNTADGGGKITGVAYDILSLDSDLRDDLLENIYTATVFLDPTFRTDGASIPSSATVPVSSAQRVVLAEATETGEHHLPLEITVYAWPEGLK